MLLGMPVEIHFRCFADCEIANGPHAGGTAQLYQNHVYGIDAKLREIGNRHTKAKHGVTQCLVCVPPNFTYHKRIVICEYGVCKHIRLKQHYAITQTCNKSRDTHTHTHTHRNAGDSQDTTYTRQSAPNSDL